MTTQTWWMALAAAALVAAVAGFWAATALAQRRLKAQVRRAAETLRQQHSAVVDGLRGAQSRSQAELEQTRAGFKRQLDAAAAEPRAAAARAEERLLAAYAELDRLRRGGGPTSPAELSDGFAATRPMREGL
ncbi:MAG: hypothetical protein ABI433_20185 [Burkholderiaceae bacterium]